MFCYFDRFEHGLSSWCTTTPVTSTIRPPNTFTHALLATVYMVCLLNMLAGRERLRRGGMLSSVADVPHLEQKPPWMMVKSVYPSRCLLIWWRQWSHTYYRIFHLINPTSFLSLCALWPCALSPPSRTNGSDFVQQRWQRAATVSVTQPPKAFGRPKDKPCCQKDFWTVGPVAMLV